MALSSDLQKIGFTPRAADFIGDTQTATISGAGTTQGAGTALTSSINRVTTAAAGVNDAVVLPLALTFKQSFIIIRNDTADTIQVFPASGDTINALAANTAITQVTATMRIYFKISTTKWIST